MFRRGRLLPKVPIYGFIGGIPETFGGRTSVCLQRSNAFAELDNRHVEILTLSPGHGTHPETVTKRLRDEGRIGDRVTIRNVWADLRRATDDELKRIAVKNRVRESHEHYLLPYEGNPESLRTDANGKVLQTDRFRQDGTRVISYRTDTEQLGTPGGRSVTLFSRAGEAVGQWDEQYELYFSWMDWIFGSKPTVLINDGPALAKYLWKYRRDNVAFVQTIHNRHSTSPRSWEGRISSAYMSTLLHMERFDRVAILTTAQRDDLAYMGYGVDNLVVLPNMSAVAPIKQITTRERSRGLMLARLEPQKRVDHAIRAMGLIDDEVNATLDIYGEGRHEEWLIRLIEELDLAERVRMRGYDRSAKDQFANASFSVLSSRFEGQGLVLLESMAAGCIPIAYDIDYGPSDIIRHGVDGFLVPPGDVEALSRTIQKVATMPEKSLLRMRKAAVRRVDAYSPRSVVRRWGDLLRKTIAEKRNVHAVKFSAELIGAKEHSAGISARIRLKGKGLGALNWVMVSCVGRNQKHFGRVSAEIEKRGDDATVTAVLPSELLELALAERMDVSVDVRLRGDPGRARVKSSQESLLPVRVGGVELYSTAYGNLSVGPRSTVE